MRQPAVPAVVTFLVLGAVIAGPTDSGLAALPTNGPVTKAEATAYAHAVNLGAADVPAMVSVSPEGENQERASNSEAVCGVRGRRVENVVDIQSPQFKSGEGFKLTEVRSEVEVMPTAVAESKLAEEQAALGKPRVRTCLKRRFEHDLARSVHGRSTRGVRTLLGRTNISVLHPTIPHSLGFRIVVHVTYVVHGSRIRVRIYADGFSFFVGPAEVSLSTISFSSPVPTEQQLLSALYSRATA